MIAIQFERLINDLDGVSVTTHFKLLDSILKQKFKCACGGVRASACIFWPGETFQGTKILDHFPNDIVKVCDSQIWILPQSTHLISVAYLVFNQTRTNTHSAYRIVDSRVHNNIYVHAWCNYCLWKRNQTKRCYYCFWCEFMLCVVFLSFGLLIAMPCISNSFYEFAAVAHTTTEHRASRRRWWYMNTWNDKTSRQQMVNFKCVWVYLASWERNFLSPSLSMPLRMGFTLQNQSMMHCMLLCILHTTYVHYYYYLGCTAIVLLHSPLVHSPTKDIK